MAVKVMGKARLCRVQIDKVCRMALGEDQGASSHKDYLIKAIATISVLNQQAIDDILEDEKSENLFDN